MVRHAWKKVDSLTLVFVAVISLGVFVPYIIALSTKNVTPFIPYISEGGGNYPEAGVFGILLTISAFLGLWIMKLRYLVVEQQSTKPGKELNMFLNKLTLFFGCAATLSLVVVSSFPATTVGQVHNSAVGLCSVCFAIYIILQTWISLRISGSTHLPITRLILTVLYVVSLLIVAIFGILGSTQWKADHWTGSKIPADDGFTAYLISSAAEWVLTFLLISFFVTYLPEFKKCILHFHLELDDGRQRLSNLDIRHP